MSILRIAITGPESSGKSTLAKFLAERFHTSFAAEFAREYLTKTEGEYELKDLVEIARGQLENERKAIRDANKICFFDTDMLVLKIWASFRYGRVPKFIETSFRESKIDAYLLCSPDIPWEPDPFRESPDNEERQKLFELYQNELEINNRPYFIVKGLDIKREEGAVSFVKTRIL